ncbi:hypothetical protein XELAEV_18008704mg [Xenopus laevis]|uniref:Uncharacterized protein n=1 Tax=Xenopus laevis TaxID=8355 RepID=A0A974HZW5_XENLA|nr:hypothetical protein XELAEV_18008704mg [Xenopus laevis]
MDLVILSLSLTVKLQVSYNLHYSYIERLLVQRSNKNCVVTKENDHCNTSTDATNRVNPTDSEVSNIAPVLVQYNEKVLVGFNNLNNLNCAIIPTFPCEFQTYSKCICKNHESSKYNTNKLHQKCKCRNVTLVFCFDNGG